MCHSTTNFTTSTFNHATTPFPLTGATLPFFVQPVIQKVFQQVKLRLIVIHAIQHNITSAPNHVAQSYPHDCTMCHSTTNFTTSTFNHATTSFP